VFRRAWFSEIPDVLAELRIAAIDGALIDLGVSSAQIDDAAAASRSGSTARSTCAWIPTRGESAAEFIARAFGARTDGGHSRLW
jgi:16S rRNA (cytosine1402-N4)-methyltransferase